jgi:hypothetical protein
MTPHYIRTRRAWTPRFWPMALGTGVVVFAVNVLLAPGVLIAIAIGVGVGLGGGVVRWELWKARHPLVTLDEYITDLRSSARWN